MSSESYEYMLFHPKPTRQYYTTYISKVLNHNELTFGIHTDTIDLNGGLYLCMSAEEKLNLEI